MLARFPFQWYSINKSTDLKSWSLIKTFQFGKKKKRDAFFFYLCLILTPLNWSTTCQERRVLFFRFPKTLSIRENLCLAFNNCLVGDIGLLLMGSQNFVAVDLGQKHRGQLAEFIPSTVWVTQGRSTHLELMKRKEGASISHLLVTKLNMEQNRFPARLFPVSPDQD